MDDRFTHFRIDYKDMPKSSDDDYIVVFQMAKLSKLQAKKVGVGILSGLVGMVICLLIFGGKYKILSFSIIGIFLFVGYFLIGNKFVNNKTQNITNR